MTQRETLVPLARRRHAHEHQARQRKPHRRTATARAQQDESNQNAGGRAGKEPIDPNSRVEAMRPQDPHTKACRQRRQGRLEAGL